MSYLVRHITADLHPATAVSGTTKLREAIELMLNHDYSQVPVEIRTQRGAEFHLLTSDDILHATVAWGAGVIDGEMMVGELSRRVTRMYYEDDSLFDLISGEGELQPALIIDAESQRLLHVVTGFDIAQYFSRLSKASMQAQAIEEDIKDLIKAAYRFSDGTMDEQLRQTAIDKITSNNIPFTSQSLATGLEGALSAYCVQVKDLAAQVDEKCLDAAYLTLLEDLPRSPTQTDMPLPNVVQAQDLRSRLKAAIEAYKNDETERGPIVNEAAMSIAYEKLNYKAAKPKTFNELTLADYISLFFNKHCWGRCESAAGRPQDVSTAMLKAIRDIRNKLAHGREGEITPKDREQLQACSRWLAERKPAMLSKLDASAPDRPEPIQTIQT